MSFKGQRTKNKNWLLKKRNQQRNQKRLALSPLTQSISGRFLLLFLLTRIFPKGKSSRQTESTSVFILLPRSAAPQKKLITLAYPLYRNSSGLRRGAERRGLEKFGLNRVPVPPSEGARNGRRLIPLLGAFITFPKLPKLPKLGLPKIWPT